MSYILRSIFITVSISLAAGFALKSFLGFWEIFTIATAVQYLLYYYFNIFANKKTLADKLSQEITNITNDLESIIARQEIQVECPCGNNTIPVVLFMDEELIINCNKCNNKLKITPEITTLLVTEPLNLENIEPVFDKLKRTNV